MECCSPVEKSSKSGSSSRQDGKDVILVVLITGANGFIGRYLADALAAAGHQVVCAVRNSSRLVDSQFRHVTADFTRDFEPADWAPRVAGIDVVINAVGIIREHGAQTFDAIHSRAPRALFSACADAGVRLVMQISALGADEHARSRYHLSKKAADDFLAGLPLRSVIVQPSLVFGSNGASARMFTTLASLPVIALPGRGEQMIQPVHVDDLTGAVLALLDRTAASGTRVPVVGPQPMTLKTFLSKLRNAMGLEHGYFLPVPMPLVRIAAKLGELLPGSLLDPETLQMLERGNTASADQISKLLGREPRRVEDFIVKSDVSALRLQARLNWLLPILSVSIALVWIVTGIVSLGLYPVEASYALLARVGITGILAPVMLYGAALLDLAFGIAILVLSRRHWLWLAQLAVILFYTAVITWKLPEFWLHPYGPLLKNLPMIAAIWLLLELEER
jgi:uncharacterized protein YbjT (DUF2867 family)